MLASTYQRGRNFRMDLRYALSNYDGSMLNILQDTEVAFALQQTQSHLTHLPVTPPKSGGDQHHQSHAKFPFIKYSDKTKGVYNHTVLSI
jgi:hypothetical protein